VARGISRIIFENTRVFLKIHGPRLDFTESQGVISKYSRDFSGVELFFNRTFGEHGPPSVDRAARTRGHGGGLLAHGMWVLGLAGAHRRWWRGGGAGRGCAGGVLTGAQAATERRCDGEEDQWWLEFAVRVKEGTRELKSEGW
jgi:hypothetical protein